MLQSQLRGFGAPGGYSTKTMTNKYHLPRQHLWIPGLSLPDPIYKIQHHNGQNIWCCWSMRRPIYGTTALSSSELEHQYLVSEDPASSRNTHAPKLRFAISRCVWKTCPNIWNSHMKELSASLRKPQSRSASSQGGLWREWREWRTQKGHFGWANWLTRTTTWKVP